MSDTIAHAIHTEAVLEKQLIKQLETEEYSQILIANETLFYKISHLQQLTSYRQFKKALLKQMFV